MSIETWKKEFYPVPADKTEAGDALAHSIKKWEGLRAENLAKHRVRKGLGSSYLKDAAWNRFWVIGDTCALCWHHLSVDIDSEDAARCESCPLAQARSGVPCDTATAKEQLPPYWYWVEKRDPEPMLRWLVMGEKKVSGL